MARLEHPCKTEVPHLPHKAALIRPVDLQTRVTRFLELLQVAVGDGEGDFFASDPAAGEIAIAVNEGDFNTLVEDVG